MTILRTVSTAVKYRQRHQTTLRRHFDDVLPLAACFPVVGFRQTLSNCVRSLCYRLTARRGLSYKSLTTNLREVSATGGAGIVLLLHRRRRQLLKLVADAWNQHIYHRSAGYAYARLRTLICQHPSSLTRSSNSAIFTVLFPHPK